MIIVSRPVGQPAGRLSYPPPGLTPLPGIDSDLLSKSGGVVYTAIVRRLRYPTGAISGKQAEEKYCPPGRSSMSTIFNQAFIQVEQRLLPRGGG